MVGELEVNDRKRGADGEPKEGADGPPLSDRQMLLVNVRMV